MTFGAKFIVHRYADTDIEQAHDLFSLQKEVLDNLLKNYIDSPLYQTLELTQADIRDWSSKQLKDYLAQFVVVDYKSHILPLVSSGQGITQQKADFHIRTSGTSDAHQGGKLIPAQWSSIQIERKAIKRTLGYYYKANPNAKIIRPYAFSLTASYDRKNKIGYISGAMRRANAFFALIMYPSKRVISIKDPAKKRTAVIKELLRRKPKIRSIHGVPSWPLSFIDELIEKNPKIAKRILRYCEYVSIGGGAPEDYKHQFEKRLRALGLEQQFFASNNHNASEGFFGAQIKNFDDLDYNWMKLMDTLNFFLFVPIEVYTGRKKEKISQATMIQKSHLLHEVQPDQEYFMLVANDRIPWLYDIKDRVVFQKDDSGLLEYLVTGRHSMSSNIFNEHLESDHLDKVLLTLKKQGYTLYENHYVAGIEVNSQKTAGKFHILIEGEVDNIDGFTREFDKLLAQENAQWALFRTNNERITACNIVVKPYGYIKSTMMKLQLSHEQSKIPHLSNHNYSSIVKPLLEYQPTN